MHKKYIIESIQQWHKLARPKTSPASFNVQLGCHFEEIAEMLETLVIHTEGFPDMPCNVSHTYEYVKLMADRLKSGEITASINNRKEFIDSIADQVVTGVGTAYLANMEPVLALDRVDTSNWSKYVDGKPVFDENGKIAKPASYQKPDLEGCY